MMETSNSPFVRSAAELLILLLWGILLRPSKIETTALVMYEQYVIWIKRTSIGHSNQL